ncbi:carboxypeptidase regulatory-like domain-containing protein [Corallococcus sp. AB049A]|uniref:carboxypeptidase-like regulatory domain-containing protein n=1 Tax=Corallococcus sp. AB049A TaxID=2316721 RepID=UPI000EEFB5CB|nr:carboxypeptidase-like regulatory domain-containing protein [Corallococcus sp. AB049A]RKI65006.1 carboxypeptidase regulatory-like domain-containing protein [Corallococcus sp. AB049A]
MRWSWVGLVAVVLACAEAPRPVLKRWPVEEVPVVVRVVDAANQPVPGVSLAARRADSGSNVARGGTTDVTGTARLQVMPGWYVLQAEAPGFVSLIRTDARVPFGAEARWDVTLERAAAFVGRVVDLKGQPVAGAVIQVTPSTDEDVSLSAESDDEGRFRIDGVPAGAVKLLAEKDGWSPTRLELQTPQPELTVVMGGLGSLRIQVRGPDGRPVSARATSISSVEEERRHFERFPERAEEATVFQKLRAGRYLVSGEYEPVPGCEWTRTIEVQVLPEQQAEATVSFEGLRDTGPWRGRAVDTHGKAFDHGAVIAWIPGEDPEAAGLSGKCKSVVGPDGSFAIPHVFKPLAFLTWEEREYSPGPEARGPFHTGTGEAVVFRDIIGGLKGRVVRPDGQPVGYFQVDGHSANNPQGEYVQSVPMTHVYQWIINVVGFAPALVRAQGEDGELRQAPDALLDVGRTVQGRLFASDGRTGMKDQQVELMEVFDLEGHGPRHPRTTRTDAEGRFQFEHVPGRRQFLRVDAKKHGTVLHALEPDEVAVRLRLVSSAELHGSMTDGARVPLAAVSVDVRCEGGFRAFSGTDWSGHFTLRIPGDRECIVHPDVGLLNVRGVPHSPPVAFSPTRLRLKPGSEHAWAPTPRQGPAALKVSVEASREFVSAFLLPGDVPWPRSPEALDALIRAGFHPDGDDDGFTPSFMLGAVFHFSHLPAGHYTLFIRDEMDGADAVLRIPVELTGTVPHIVRSERPGLGGGRPYTR